MTSILYLFSQGVRIYAVQAQNNSRADYFYEALADRSHGKRLNLDQFETIVDMMMAICYRETGPAMLEAFEREVRAREGAGIRQDLDKMFNTLRHPVTDVTSPTDVPGDLTDTPTTSTTGRKRKRRADPDAEGDKTIKRLKGALKKPLKGAAKKPWALKKSSSGSIVSASLVKKAKRVSIIHEQQKLYYNR